MNEFKRKMSSLEDLKEIHTDEESTEEEPIIDKKNLRIEKVRKGLIEYVEANEKFLDVDKTIKHVNQIKKWGTLRKYRTQLEEKINKIDKENYVVMDTLRQEMFEMINENNLNIDPNIMKKIARSGSKRELRYLLFQIKKLYNLKFEDIDRTHKSIYAILTPMGNQMR